MILNEKLRKELWKIIDKSKKGTNFDSEKQKEKLHKILKDNYVIDDIEMLLQEFNCVVNEYIESKDFRSLHKSDGGIVYGGDDTFYMDFASWLVAQGNELYDEYFKTGSKVVVRYIKDNEINRQNYEYECMMYAFFNMEE